ncbi:hypothetical protein BTJ39_19460 [Izhakiella australiensis]|uniref:PTS EIIA type-4 domain-containing protein n=1 Tax=Izhakiella australiensis TaxID=1926881 RepID=A0A1S8YGX5_9GAMM|nr:PTS sugar transporter subunit IIA [Izhakiella australiensis]OON37993.1 hypothetical protein BTJ39_19460 [Izhakiella australiensis]
MTAIIFAAHGLSAPGMKDSVEMVVGPQTHFYTLMLSQEEGIAPFKAALTGLVNRLRSDGGQQILILTDMPAGTPYNLSVQLALELPDIAVLSGANFPMVLTALEQADDSLDELTHQVIETGRSAIARFQEVTATEDDF